MPYPSLLHPETLSLGQSTADLYLHRRHSNTVLPQSLRGTWVLVHTKFIWALWASLVGMGFDSKCELAPPTILLGLLLCPWMWGISSPPLQPLTLLLGFLWPWTWGISSRLLQQSTESLRRNGVTIIVNKRIWNAVLGCNLKNDRIICLFQRQIIQYHGNPSLCPDQ